MRELFIFLTFITLSFNYTFSQVYKNQVQMDTPIFFSRQSGTPIFFLEINKDSAHLEVFSFYEYFCIKRYDRILFPNNKPNNNNYFGDEQFKIYYVHSKYYLFFNDSLLKSRVLGENNKIEMFISTLEAREYIRKQAFLSERKKLINNLIDSLDSPRSQIRRNISLRNLFINGEGYSYTNLIYYIDKIVDTLINQIMVMKDPYVDYYYKVGNNISNTDSTEIYRLLERANFEYTFSQYFLYKLALEKPEYLIYYIDMGLPNKHIVLSAIRNHKNRKEIKKKLKETKQILRKVKNK